MPNFSGIWTVTQQMQAKGQSIWPAVPGAPTSVTGTAGSAQVSVAFTAPSDAGYPATITSYTATSSPGGFTASGSSSPLVVTGLTNGTAYTFTVTATNATGTGPASSPSGSVTPVSPAWLASLGDNSTRSDYGYGSYVDSFGNVYTIGSADPSTERAIMVKYDSSGVIQWQKYYQVSTNTSAGYGITVDSSNNIYVAINDNSTSLPALMKLDSSGAIQWQKQFDNGQIYGVSTDSSGNVNVALSGNSNPNVAQFNSSGTLNWQRRITGATNRYIPTSCLVTAASGNIYLVGIEANTGNSNNAFIFKYDSSGNIQWRKKTQFNNGSAGGSGIALDSSENVYIGATSNGTPQGWLLKYDSSSNFIWAKEFNNCYGGKVAVDTSNNVYVTGGYGNYQYIMKFDSSGTIQFQRTIIGAANSGGSAVAVQPYSIYVVNSFMYVAAFMTNYAVGGYQDILTEKLPSDGSKTGTYANVGIQSITYAASSITIDGTSTVNLANSAMSDSAGSGSVSTSSFASSTASLTSAVVTL